MLGGLVVASYTGLGVPLSVKISDGALNKSAQDLSAAVTEAVCDGQKRAQV